MKIKTEGKVHVRKLTVDDILSINNMDHLDGKNLVQDGYYKVWLESDPEKYVYMKTFGGLDPDNPSFDLSPYAYIDQCGFLGDYLHIDLAAIQNDDRISLPRSIEVEYIADVSGENTKIFRSKESGQYYMRVSSYPREQFARWMTAHRSRGRWEEDNCIRPNVSFTMRGARETVRASNWNGSAVYADQFDLRFEKISQLEPETEAAKDNTQSLAEAIFADIDAFIQTNKTGYYSPTGNYLGTCVEFGIFSDEYEKIKRKYGVGTKKMSPQKTDKCDACGGKFPCTAMYYQHPSNSKLSHKKLCKECYRSNIEFFEEDEVRQNGKTT